MSTENAPPAVSVILVSYNTASLTIQCVESIQRQQGVDFEILVVDNASPDGSAELLEKAFPREVTLINSQENLGFGRANNLAAQQARGPLLFLLNPDTELTEPDTLATLCRFMDRHPECALAGSAIFEPRRDNWVRPKKRYPAEKFLKRTQGLRDLPGDIAWLLGASLMVRKKAYDGIGGFDPDFFLYGEDADICLRLRQAGQQIGYCEQAVIRHVAGASESGQNPKETWLRKKRGYFLFCRKHYHPDDVRAIAEKTLSKARWNRLGLKLQTLLGKDNSARLRRLEATIEAAREALNS